MKLIFISLLVKRKEYVNIVPFAFFHFYISKKTLGNLSHNKNSSVLYLFIIFFLKKTWQGKEKKENLQPAVFQFDFYLSQMTMSPDRNDKVEKISGKGLYIPR